jgi:hypothetical protein
MSEMAIVVIIVLFVGFWSVTHKVAKMVDMLAKMVDMLQELNKTIDFINKHIFDIKEIGSERHRLLMDERRHLR